MPNMFIVGTLQGKTFTAEKLYEILSKTSSRWTKESEHGLGDSFKGPMVRKAFNIDESNKTFDYKYGASEDILLLANDYLKRGKHEKAAQIFFLLAADPYAVGNPINYIGNAYEALLKLYGPEGQLTKQTYNDGNGKFFSIHARIIELAKKYNDALVLSNKQANDLKAAQEAKAEEAKQVAAPVVLNADVPVLPLAPLFTPKSDALPVSATAEDNPITAALETQVTPPRTRPELYITIPTRPQAPAPLKTPLPKAHVEPEVIKPLTPITPISSTVILPSPTSNPLSPVTNEDKQDAPANDTIAMSAIPPVSPTAAPSSTKPVTPVVNEDKQDVPANDTIATSAAPPVSPTAAPSSTKPVTPVVNEDKQDVPANDTIAISAVPTVSPTAAPSSTKPVTPVVNEDKQDVPANDTIAISAVPTASPTAAPSSTKPVTPVVNEDKLDVPANNAVTTSAVPPVSPTATPSSPQPAAPVDEHEAGLFGVNDIPAQQPTAATPSAPAPTPPRFKRVETLLDNLNAIVAKHPAVGATIAIQAEQKAMFISNDKAVLSLKDLSYNELKYLSNHMQQVQDLKTIDARFDHVRTETGYFRKHLGNGRGETPVWAQMRAAVKRQAMIQAALATQKADRDLAATAAEIVITAADASTAPAAKAPATNAKFKLSAEHHKELATLVSQHSGRFFTRFGKTSSTKFFNANFEKAEPEVALDNTSTNTKRM
jgi:hypothetical protein